MSKHMSEDLRQVLDGGVTLAQLGRLFNMQTVTVRSRMASVKPYGIRDGDPIYKMRDAAPHLVGLPDNVVDRVIRMGHMDLPPMLKKEYWTGQAQRLKVMEMENELWRTESVLAYVGDMMKDIRMSIMLASDAVEREIVLTDKQRDAIKSLLDGILESIVVKLKATFEAKRSDPMGEPGAGRHLSIEERTADL